MTKNGFKLRYDRLRIYYFEWGASIKRGYYIWIHFASDAEIVSSEISPYVMYRGKY